MHEPSELVRMESIGAVPKLPGDLMFTIDVIDHDQGAGCEGFPQSGWG
jgi:hypothetical protein